ncbi:MAG: preprotein translocase subunit SecE [Proteobacteria bacterium]|nr:preprotein translocase subunit SecE [Pseudomonadota bacterium]
MNTKVAKPDKSNASSPGADIALYAVAVLLLAAGVFGFYWFSAWTSALRGLLALVGAIAAFGVFTRTAYGRKTLEFIEESRFELRKVVWPTRQESIRMTGVIIVVIVVFSLFLAGIDLLIGNGVNWLLSA